MKKVLFIILILSTFLFLPKTTQKAYALSCPHTGEATDTSCPVCPPGWAYVDVDMSCMVVDSSIAGKPTGTEDRNNCIYLGLNCTSFGSGYSCSTSMHKIGSFWANGCCNSSECKTNQAGTPTPTPPPVGGGCDVGPTCENNNKPNSACAPNQLCQDTTMNCGTFGKCVINDAGPCQNDDNCGGGSSCVGGRCVITSSSGPENCPQCSNGCVWSGSINNCVPIYSKSSVNCSVKGWLNCRDKGGICFAGCGCALSDCSGNDLGFGQLCNEGKSCDTALGTISTTNVSSFSSTVFGILLGIAGGIAVLLIIISGYRIMTSQGNPEILQGARDQLTAAIVGLLFIIFSFVILEVIGVNILHIPGIN